MFERATWPMRKLAWWLEEKVIWPLSDALRGRGAHAAPVDPEAHAAPADPEAALPLRRPDLRIALGTVGGAAVIGIAVAALLVSRGGEDQPAGPASVPHVAASPPPAANRTQAEGEDPNALQGVTPKFNAASQAAAPQTTAEDQTQAQTSPTQETNSKPSSIPPGAADSGAALPIARDFAGAFVLYEVGKTNAKVKRTFARTATPGLTRALKDRPPRLPDSVKVPTAKVRNVVLGVRHGRLMEASVSLLRLGTLSELRLTLILRHKAWAVSEVRG